MASSTIDRPVRAATASNRASRRYAKSSLRLPGGFGVEIPDANRAGDKSFG